MTINEGRNYKIVNAKSGTALDLSGTDGGAAVIGWESHNGDNQKWYLEKDGEHWVFRNVHFGHYLGYIKGSVGLTDGLPLVGLEERFHWDIWPDEQDREVYRIFVPGAPAPGLNVDLSDFGNPKNGTPVTLWGKWEGKHQTWRFVEV